jgi:hypothetical protein
MITGSARHSLSNGGIERFNKTIQSKVARTTSNFVVHGMLCRRFKFNILALHVDAEVARRQQVQELATSVVNIHI